MNQRQTFEQFKEFKLHSMAGCYDTLQHQPAEKQQAPPCTLIAMMAEAETISSSYQRTNLYLRIIKFKYIVLPEKIHCTAERNLFKEQLTLL